MITFLHSYEWQMRIRALHCCAQWCIWIVQRTPLDYIFEYNTLPRYNAFLNDTATRDLSTQRTSLDCRMDIQATRAPTRCFATQAKCCFIG